MPFALIGARKRCAGQFPAFAVQRLDAGDVEIDFALFGQFAHPVDAVLGGAEAVAVMDECQALGDRCQI